MSRIQMKQNINIVLQSRKKKRNKQKQNKQTKKQTKQNKTKKNKTKQTGLKNHKNPKALIEYLNNVEDICGKINE